MMQFTCKNIYILRDFLIQVRGPYRAVGRYIAG